MTEQDQIDYLKRTVASLDARLQIIESSYQLVANNQVQPICGTCGITMFEGATCGLKANHCPMGIGKIDEPT